MSLNTSTGLDRPVSKYVALSLAVAGPVYLIWSKRVQKSVPAHSLTVLSKGHGKAFGELTGMPKLPLPKSLRGLLGLFLAPFYTLQSFKKAMSEHRHLHLLADLHTLFNVDTFSAKLPLQPRYVVTKGAKNFEHILKTNFNNYHKGEATIPRFHDLLGQGIFNADGDLWYQQRKTASRMFTQNQMTTRIWKVITNKCDGVINCLLAGGKDSTIDVFNVMNRFTLDAIGEIGFGRDIGALENAESPFLESFDRGQQILFMRMIVPGWRLLRKLGLCHEQTSQHHFKLLKDYSLETVRSLKQKIGTGAGDSFIGSFMREEANAGRVHDEKMMQDLVINFLIAGRDTTAQSLSWTLFLLCTHHQVEQAVLQEISQLVGEKELAYDDLNRFSYLHAVISESLRLYPSIPLDLKVALNDDVLPDGSEIQKGDVVVYNIFAMGRSKDVWGDDADEFKPERWLNMASPSSFTYPVFNAGPRECLGKRLAMVEMKACLITILRTVKLELVVPQESIHYDAQLTMGMASGLPCKVTRR
jgi:fatty acid omega-hydroxylase